jgi:raffinose/stachyose/melibiose transport system permease protein
MADVLAPGRRDESTRSTRPGRAPAPGTPAAAGRRKQRQCYPHWFYLPAAVVFVGIFVVPTVMAFFYAFTRWTLFEWEFIGLENFRQFFRQPALSNGLRNTVIYAVVTSGLKVVLGMGLGVLVTSRLHFKGTLRSMIFFPVLVSTVAIGITFKVMMHPTDGLLNRTIGLVGLVGPDWLTDPQTALLSVAMVDVWKGVGFAMVIYIAGILSIPPDLHEAVAVDGGGAWAQFRYVTLPLSRPATFTVIILSFVSGLRTFDLIWTMTNGGPGYTTDVLTSSIFKQYQAGFYGLSTAGNVVLFVMVSALAFPLNWYLQRRELRS